MTSGSQDFAKFKDQCLEQLAADTLLPAGALRVGIQIVLHLNHKTREAFPGFGRLQKLLGVGRMTVIRSVQALEEAGHIKVMRSRKGKQNEANRYRFIPRQSATAQRDNATVAPTSQRGTRAASPARLGVVSPVVPEPLILTSDL